MMIVEIENFHDFKFLNNFLNILFLTKNQHFCLLHPHPEHIIFVIIMSLEASTTK